MSADRRRGADREAIYDQLADGVEELRTRLGGPALARETGDIW
jgi:hypothetical protein